MKSFLISTILSFGFVSAPLAAEAHEIAAAENKNVGRTSCSSFTERNPKRNIWNIHEAELSTRSGGKYRLTFRDEKSTKVLELNQDLSVESARTEMYSNGERLGERGRWNLVQYEYSGSRPVKINSDGSFYIGMAVSTRSACTFEGIATFTGDSRTELFPNLIADTNLSGLVEDDNEQIVPATQRKLPPFKGTVDEIREVNSMFGRKALYNSGTAFDYEESLLLYANSTDPILQRRDNAFFCLSKTSYGCNVPDFKHSIRSRSVLPSNSSIQVASRYKGMCESEAGLRSFERIISKHPEFRIVHRYWLHFSILDETYAIDCSVNPESAVKTILSGDLDYSPAPQLIVIAFDSRPGKFNCWRKKDIVNNNALCRSRKTSKGNFYLQSKGYSLAALVEALKENDSSVSLGTMSQEGEKQAKANILAEVQEIYKGLNVLIVSSEQVPTHAYRSSGGFADLVGSTVYVSASTNMDNPKEILRNVTSSPYASYNPKLDFYGIAESIDYGNNLSNDKAWVFPIIFDNEKGYYHIQTSEQTVRTISHEIGHLLGLEHPTGKDKDGKIVRIDDGTLMGIDDSSTVFSKEQYSKLEEALGKISGSK